MAMMQIADTRKGVTVPVRLEGLSDASSHQDATLLKRLQRPSGFPAATRDRSGAELRAISRGMDDVMSPMLANLLGGFGSAQQRLQHGLRVGFVAGYRRAATDLGARHQAHRRLAVVIEVLLQPVGGLAHVDDGQLGFVVGHWVSVAKAPTDWSEPREPM